MGIHTVSPFKCRMWEMHDRLSENIDPRSCASLIDSIKRHGQKHPVLGRLVDQAADHQYELIYGARRLFAAQYLGIDLLVDVREVDNRSALVEMDVENRPRADISPYERGRSYQRWLASGYFKNQSELAKALAVSDSQVSRLLRYAELPAVVVGAFRSPSDIREEWAVALAKMCAEPKKRARVMDRARTAGTSSGQRSPQAMFDYLANGRGPHSPLSPRSRADVVKDPGGRPLFRVRFQAKTVQLILPREGITSAVLTQINEHIAQVLCAAAKRPAGAVDTRACASNGAVVNGRSPEVLPPGTTH